MLVFLTAQNIGKHPAVLWTDQSFDLLDAQGRTFSVADFGPDTTAENQYNLDDSSINLQPTFIIHTVFLFDVATDAQGLKMQNVDSGGNARTLFTLFILRQGGPGRTGPLASATTVQQPSVCTGYKTYGVPTVPALNTSKTYQAIVATNKGSFTITLLPKAAPITVQSFIFLAHHHYFDGVKFHRVIPGFIIQGGDPSGTGECGPGYQFRDENLNAGYTRGTVAMANAGPGTNGSQYFVVLKDTPLPPDYSVFGHVSSGMSTVDRIAAVPLGTNAQGERSAPLVKVYMKGITIKIR